MRAQTDGAGGLRHLISLDGLTREALIRHLLLVAADEPNLVDNILDDEA